MKTQDLIHEFLQSRRAANLSPVTIDWYRSKLAAFAQPSPELPLDPAPIEAFLGSINGCPETKHAYYRTLRAFYNWLSDRHGVTNAMAKVCAPRLPKKTMATLDTNAILQLVSSAADLKAKALISLLIDTGIRSTEAASLRKQDIKAQTALVRGKTGERKVPISDQTRDLLLATSAQSDSDRVFPGLNRDGVYRIISSHMETIGVIGPKRGGHRLRHAFGRCYVLNGGDLRSLQEIMGHASITTTEKYVYLDTRDIVRQHHQYSPLAHHQKAANFRTRDKRSSQAQHIEYN
ncbi:MAG: tyrosine-type recombinase/integrase, partial [Chloroflexota bacterium]